jgi:formamidopyrimidine-DNA glycosylase
MPELPEVETIARALAFGGRGQPSIVGRKIASVQVLWARTVAEPDPAQLMRRASGQTVDSIQRRGKFLVIHLDQETLLLHLRMSGDVRVESASLPAAAHDRLILNFQDGWRMAFNDTRKFGRAWLVQDPQTVLAALGPEPLEDAFTPDWLLQNLRSRRRLLKPLLLDQSFIAGLGNIYTDEALHLAKLHPLRNSAAVTPAEAQALWQAIRDVLQAGIQNNGASIDWVYRGGDFQNHFRAYGRTGLPCPVCGTLIQRLTVGQRGTHICPVCQSL